MEHEKTEVATYSYNGRRDKWRIQEGVFANATGLDDLGPVNLTGVRYGNDVPAGDDVFHMMRFFDHTLTKPDIWEAFIAAFQPTHLVMGANYWLTEGRQSKEAPDRIATQLVTTLTKLRTSGKLSVRGVFCTCSPVTVQHWML